MDPHQGLSPSEVAVLRLLERGRSAAEAALELDLPLVRVAEMLQEIRSRYGVSSTSASLTSARRSGDLDSPGPPGGNET